MRRAIPSVLVMVLCGCGHARPQRVEAAGHVEVWRLELGYSNVHVVRSGKTAIMVDAGSPGDLDALVLGLADIELTPEKLKLVVLTHGHGDHAGMGAALQKRGVPVITGAGDEALTRQGHNDDLKPQNVTGMLIKPFVDFPFAPFSPDETVKERRSLAKWGLPSVEVEQMAGHTPGSLVVLLPRGDALVGDMFAGGWFGGKLFADVPGEHYYQADAAQSRRNISTLLARGVRRFHMGHGGPADADAVRWAFAEP